MNVVIYYYNISITVNVTTMLFHNTNICTELDEFEELELYVFDYVQNKIIDYLQKIRYDNGDFLHGDSEDKIIIMNMVRGIIINYKLPDETSPATIDHKSTYIYYVMRYFDLWDDDFLLNELYIAVIFIYYSLILLEFFHDPLSIEEICTKCFLIEKNSESYVKIMIIFYEIVYGNHPVLSIIRRLLLFPDQFIESS